LSEEPLVSIITPAHDAARFVLDTIRSVQAQSYRHWEQIVIDDASRDRTRDLVAEAARGDPRIRLVALDRNSGPAGARNAGLAEARGRYVAFLDADDLWLPEKLARQLAFMRDRDAAFSFTAYSIIDEQGHAVGQPVRVPARIDYRGLLKNTTIGCLTVVLDRERVGGPLSMPDLPQHEDLSLWFRLLKGGMIAHGLPEILARYRVVAGSASRNKLRAARHMWKVYREQEGLAVPDAMWCYAHYAWRAYWKNRT
jgi:teichuronic acid biosynthesis glycosyltransferase TuaG